MVDCDDLLEFYEIASTKNNESICHDIYDEIFKHIKENITFTGCNSYIEKVISLKNEFIYTSDYLEIFFDLLTKYKYRPKHEIKDAVYILGELDNPNKNSEVIKRFLHSPYIDDISFDTYDTFTLISEKLGTFSFQLAKSYFHQHEGVLSYMNANRMRNHCHMHTKRLAYLFPEMQTVTSLCQNYFVDRYYHSYTHDLESDRVIDLCANMIMDYKEYCQLYMPEEIMVLPNKMYVNFWAEAMRKSHQDLNRCEVLSMALYRQLLDLSEEEKGKVLEYKNSNYD